MPITCTSRARGTREQSWFGHPPIRSGHSAGTRSWFSFPPIAAAFDESPPIAGARTPYGLSVTDAPPRAALVGSITAPRPPAHRAVFHAQFRRRDDE